MDKKNHPYLYRETSTPCTKWEKVHPWLLHSETFSVYTGWNYTYDFTTVRLSRCWFCGNFSKWLFHQHTWFLVNMWRREILKSCKLLLLSLKNWRSYEFLEEHMQILQPQCTVKVEEILSQREWTYRSELTLTDTLCNLTDLWLGAVEEMVKLGDVVHIQCCFQHEKWMDRHMHVIAWETKKKHQSLWP